MSLEAMRKRRGFTQQELAERLNVTHGIISKWEKGLYLTDGLPHKKYRKQLCAVLDCTLDELTYGK